MGAITQKHQKSRLAKKRRRQGKLQKFKQLYWASTNKVERLRIIEKVQSLAPYLMAEKYLEVGNKSQPKGKGK